MEILRDYLLAKPGVTDDFPFGPEAMVFRVAGKIFAIMPWELKPVSIKLVEELMDHSYDLVFAKLPGKVREGLV